MEAPQKPCRLLRSRRRVVSHRLSFRLHFTTPSGANYLSEKTSALPVVISFIAISKANVIFAINSFHVIETFAEMEIRRVLQLLITWAISMYFLLFYAFAIIFVYLMWTRGY